jgi:hypothetical protein
MPELLLNILAEAREHINSPALAPFQKALMTATLAAFEVPEPVLEQDIGVVISH